MLDSDWLMNIAISIFHKCKHAMITSVLFYSISKGPYNRK